MENIMHDLAYVFNNKTKKKAKVMENILCMILPTYLKFNN